MTEVDEPVTISDPVDSVDAEHVEVPAVETPAVEPTDSPSDESVEPATTVEPPPIEAVPVEDRVEVAVALIDNSHAEIHLGGACIELNAAELDDLIRQAQKVQVDLR